MSNVVFCCFKRCTIQRKPTKLIRVQLAYWVSEHINWIKLDVLIAIVIYVYANDSAVIMMLGKPSFCFRYRLLVCYQFSCGAFVGLLGFRIGSLILLVAKLNNSLSYNALHSSATFGNCSAKPNMLVWLGCWSFITDLIKLLYSQNKAAS